MRSWYASVEISTCGLHSPVNLGTQGSRYFAVANIVLAKTPKLGSMEGADGLLP